MKLISMIRRWSCSVGWLLAGLMLVGCPAENGSSPSATTKTSSPASTPPLRVLVVDDQEWARGFADQWNARSSGEPLEVKNITLAELAGLKRLTSELIVFPPPALGDLVERELLQPIPNAVITAATASEEPPLHVEELLPVVRASDASWGRTLYAQPLGSRQLVLLYRADVFNELKLTPPQTWIEYRELAAKLADRAALGKLAPAAEKPWSGGLEPWGSGFGGAWLLGRAVSYLRAEGQLFTWFNPDTMEPRLTQPPLERTLTEMREAYQAGAKEVDFKAVSPAEARRAFFAGETAMAITWPITSDEKVAVEVGFAELPGSDEIYLFDEQQWTKHPDRTVHRATYASVAGRMVAVTREARRAKTAFRVLAWLSQPDTVDLLGTIGESGGIGTKTQLNDAGRWLPEGVSTTAAQQYATLTSETLTRSAWSSRLRVPGASEYEAALDKAVQAVLSGEQTPPEALQAATKQWEAITKQRGVSEQRRAYRRSAGTDA